MTHQYFGRRYTAGLTPEQVYKATRTDAEAQTARLEQAMADAIAASDFDLFRLALCAEGNLYPQTAINLMFSGHREGMERLRNGPDYRRGQKIMLAASRGHEAVHGTKQEQRARDAAYREHYKTVRPGRQFKSDALRITAKHFDVHERTIRRAFERAGEKMP